jgi:hypothetical protein
MLPPAQRLARWRLVQAGLLDVGEAVIEDPLRVAASLSPDDHGLEYAAR